MKRNTTLLACLVLLAGFPVSCRRDEQALKWVDLRFLAEDSYVLSASEPEPIRLQVKSTDPWEVYGTTSEWCTVSPSGGGPDELFDVLVQYTDNVELDDRLDTLVIKSDYWIGKEIPVRQKGTAYLDLDGADGLTIGQFGGEAAFRLYSNQNWSLRSDSDWIELSELEGFGDGHIAVNVADENKGERRTAQILVLDRHGETVRTVVITQDGVVLEPSTTYLRFDYRPQSISVDVASNTEWFAECEGASWVSLPSGTFSGDDRLDIGLAENTGYSIRNATVILKTKAAAGFEQIIKTVTLRQAYNPSPEYYDFDDAGLSQWIINGADNDKSSCAVSGSTLVVHGAQKIHRYNCPAGGWDFFMSEATDNASPVIYFQSGEFDMRWFVSAKNGKTALEIVDKAKTKTFPAFDVPYSNSQAHKFGIRMSPDKDGYTVFSWILDDVEIGSYTANGADVQTSAIPFSADLKFHIFLGAYEGGGTANQSTVWSGWQYTMPYEFIDWGE